MAEVVNEQFEEGTETAAAVDPVEAVEPVKEKKVVIQRDTQNGFTRPIAGTKTGKVWDIADEISKEKGRPAFRDEVFKKYLEEVPEASKGTCGTQYSRWCGFHQVAPVLKQLRAEEKTKTLEAKKAKRAEADAKAKEKADAKKAKAAEKKAAKPAKAAKVAKKAA